jgi:hypothetical protein
LENEESIKLYSTLVEEVLSPIFMLYEVSIFAYFVFVVSTNISAQEKPNY